MKVLTVGGAMIDTIAIIDSNRIELMKMRNADTSFLLLEEGRKTEALEISAHCGGGAVNTAVAMARLGCDVATIIKLGQDARAEIVLGRLADERISARWVVRDARAPTGASVLVSSHDRNAAIFTFRGANGYLADADLCDEAFAVELVHICGLSNASADCFPQLVSRAKAHGALVSTNPGIRQLSARGCAFHDALANIDILTLNRSEADVLVPGLIGAGPAGGIDPVLAKTDAAELPKLALRGLMSGGHELSLGTFLRTLIGLGPRYVVVTDGGAGAFVATREEILFSPAAPTKVMGTAGAGDAFASTFAAFIGRGHLPADAARAATVNAAAVLGHVDTQSGLMQGDVLDAKLAANSATQSPRHWKL